MPISPENKKRYPKNWGAISYGIRQFRAKNRCEKIDREGKRCTAINGEKHPITGSKVVLTVAHLDHIPENCTADNLMAMCQRCHLRYDAHHHRSCDKTKDMFTEIDMYKGE